MCSPRKPIIGLLGAPGSGKSFVASLFAELGCGVIDADQLAREALQHDDVKTQLLQWWGDEIFDEDGQVDRTAVGAIVFNDPTEKKRLEELVHPRVHAGRESLRRSMLEDPAVVAIVEDTPLLLEAGLAERMDKLVFIEAPFMTRLARVKSRGWDAAELRRREHSQATLDSKRQAAHDVIRNAGDTDETRDQVRQLLDLYRRDANHRDDMTGYIQ